MTNNYNILTLHDLKFIYTGYSKRDTPRDCSDFHNIDNFFLFCYYYFFSYSFSYSN